MKRRLDLKLLCLIFLLLDVIVAAVLVGSILHDRRSLRYERDALAVQVGITGEMDREQQEEIYAQAAGEASRHVSMHSEPVASDGQIALYLSNSEDNTCAVSVEIVIMGEETLIAESGLVEPGWRLEYLPLEKELEAGEYYCLVRCAFYTMEGNVLLGKTTRQLLLTVQ